MAAPLHIAWVLSSLGCGGAERVVLLLAQTLAARGHRCTLVTLDPRAPDFYPVPAAVARVRLALPGHSGSALAAIRNNVVGLGTLGLGLHRLAADVVVSFGDTTNIKTILASTGRRWPVVVSERVDPATVQLPPAWTWLRARTYRRAAALVVQTESVRAWAERHVDATKVAVIGNPVAPSTHDASVRGDEIVLVGRLVPQKGFDLLLHAFAEAAREHPSWRVCILGEGPQRAELRALADRLGIAANVELVGEVRDVRARLARAGLFVLASRFEGFPNALLEAMAEGCPVIATDCPSGPAEILRDCPDAALVPTNDADALATAIGRMLSSAELRRRCGDAVRRASIRFAPDAIAAAWERVLLRAAGR